MLSRSRHNALHSNELWSESATAPMSKSFIIKQLFEQANAHDTRIALQATRGDALTCKCEMILHESDDVRGRRAASAQHW